VAADSNVSTPGEDTTTGLDSCSLFAALTQAQRTALAAECTPLSLAAGAYACREGERGDELFILMEGGLEIVGHVDGAEVVYRRMEDPGDFVGEQALRADHTDLRTADVRAFTPSRLLAVSRQTYQAAVEQAPEIEETAATLGNFYERELDLAERSVMFRAMAVFDEPEFSADIHVDAGDVVFRAGDPSDHVYVVNRGAVKVLRSGEDGQTQRVARLAEGQVFGEESVMLGQPRVATVVAAEPTQLIVYSAENFLHAVSQSEELHHYLMALRRVYAFGHGNATQFDATFRGDPSIVTVSRSRTGHAVLTNLVIEKQLFHALRHDDELDGAEAQHSYLDPQRAIQRHLTTRNGELLQIDARGPWDELGRACRALENAQHFSEDAFQQFLESGNLFDAPSRSPGPDDIVCPCLHLSRAQLERHVVNGCSSVQELREASGAGSVCGGCVNELAELAGSTGTPMRLISRSDLTQDVCAFRFEPVAPAELTPSLAGQHVIVTAEIDGQKITRSYTLTSPPSQRAYREITVKREPHGLFSRWLFEAEPGTVVEISPPQGDFHIGQDGGQPVVCLVAGIGMTPALAMARSCIASGQRVTIDYSTTYARHVVAHQELRDLAANTKVDLTIRLTSRGERLRPAQVQALAHAHPGAHFFICGPNSFQQMAEQALLVDGVEPGRVHIEVFNHAQHASVDGTSKRSTAEWVGGVLSVAAVLAYVLQAALGWQPAGLIALQQQFNYQVGSGLVLAAFLLVQWWLPSLRLVGEHHLAARAYSAHRQLGWLAPLVFAAHSLDPGYGMLLLLSSVYLSNVVVGVFDQTVLASRQARERYHRGWLMVHVPLSVLTVLLGALHAYTAFAYKGG